MDGPLAQSPAASATPAPSPLTMRRATTRHHEECSCRVSSGERIRRNIQGARTIGP